MDAFDIQRAVNRRTLTIGSGTRWFRVGQGQALVGPCAGVVVVVVTQILSDVFYALLNPRISIGRAPRIKAAA